MKGGRRLPKRDFLAGLKPGQRVILGYVRVSSNSQDAAYQRDAIERAALARGERVTHWLSDVASGKTMDRPALTQALAAVRAGHVRQFWLWRLDRLSRSGIVDMLQAIELMKKHECQCVSVADTFALEGPMAPVVLSMIAWAAQMEREKIAENQAAARMRMEAQGRSWGRPREVTKEKIEAAAKLRAKGWTYREIGAELQISKSHVGAVLRLYDQAAEAENKPGP